MRTPFVFLLLVLSLLWGCGGGGSASVQPQKIYIADTINNRIIQTDDLSGTNLVAYGTQGSGAGNFNVPWGIAVDSSGRIYVADAGNNRIVRMNDMTGTGFTAFGTNGSGSGQFNNPNIRGGRHIRKDLRWGHRQ